MYRNLLTSRANDKKTNKPALLNRISFRFADNDYFIACILLHPLYNPSVCTHTQDNLTTLAFYLHLLPDEIMCHIPRSTKHDWDSRSPASLFGYDWYCRNKHLFDTLHEIAVSKKLLKINKALLRIIALQRFIHKYKLLMRGRLSNVNAVVLNNIAKAGKQIGFGFCLKLLQHSRQHYWQLKQRVCSVSPLSLCIPKHSAQLLRREVNTIKKYCEDARFICWPLASVYHQIIHDRAAFFHISTFYKYIARLKLNRANPGKRRKNHTQGIRASCSFCCMQTLLFSEQPTT